MYRLAFFAMLTVFAVTLGTVVLVERRPLLTIELKGTHNRPEVISISTNGAVAVALKAPLVASSGEGYRKAEVYALDEPVSVRTLIIKPALAVVLSPDGSILAVIQADSVIQLYTVADLQPLARIPSKILFNEIVFSRDNRLLAAPDFKPHPMYLVWDLEQDPPQVVARIPGLIVAFSPEGSSVLTTSSEQLSVWNLATGAVQHQEGPPNLAKALFSPDGRSVVAIGSRDASITTPTSSWTERHGLLCFWTLKSGDYTCTNATDENAMLEALALSANGARVATGGSHVNGQWYDLEPPTSQPIGIWSGRTGRRVTSIQTPLQEIMHLALSDDGSTVTTIGETSDFGLALMRWRVLP